MQPTIYPHINNLLDSLLSQMQTVLGDRLAGLYLYGSLVTGDFDDDISDIDLLAVTGGDINEQEFSALKAMQDAFVVKHPQWENRIEIAYLSLQALKTFKTQASQIGIISPGEPFHLITGGKDWLMNWYMVREKGVSLFGPPAKTLIEPTSKAEFVEAVKAHVAGWREWVDDSHHLPSQAYAILTLCRALYTCTHGEQVSKHQAAQWAQAELPEWSVTIQNAVSWRKAWRETVVDAEASFAETQRFVNFMVDRILSTG